MALRCAAAALVGLCLPAPATQALDRLDFLISGTEDATARAVRDASLVSVMLAEGQTDSQDLLAAARADYGRILAALYSLGHYSAVIRITIDGREAASIPPLEIPQAISAIVIEVDPGPLFRFDGARIAPLAPDTVLPDGFRSGLTAESGLVSQALDASVLAWRNVGHAKATIAEESIVADHADAALDVDLRLEPGPRLRFGPLAVEGAERMRERRVRKIAGFPEGQTFSETELRRAEDRLRRTGIFSSVTLVEADVITAPDILGVVLSRFGAAPLIS